MKMTDLITPALALIITAVTAAALLGFVHEITLKPIAGQRLKSETEAIGAIFNTAAESGKEIPVPVGSPIKSVLQVYSGGVLLGYAIFTSPAGYSGPVNIAVGVGTDGVVRGVRILRQSETPGLGANAENPAFTDQYKGKSGVLTVTKASPAGNEIEAVTSATITSNAVTKGVNDALAFFRQTLAS